jgi:hypothetical protein
MAKKPCPRMDGLCNLTDAEKAERDARAQHWMNQRKIERVAVGSFGPRILTTERLIIT